MSNMSCLLLITPLHISVVNLENCTVQMPAFRILSLIGRVSVVVMMVSYEQQTTSLSNSAPVRTSNLFEGKLTMVTIIANIPTGCRASTSNTKVIKAC
jgi:hypothetical protein